MDVREVEDFDNEVRRAGEEWGRMFEEVEKKETIGLSCKERDRRKQRRKRRKRTKEVNRRWPRPPCGPAKRR